MTIFTETAPTLSDASSHSLVACERQEMSMKSKAAVEITKSK